MASEDPQNVLDLKVDLHGLYREETFTDLGAATVRRLTPVTADGLPDLSRSAVYMGETSLMTQVGPIPLQFTLEVETLEEAFRRFPEGVKVAVERLNDRAQEAMRAEASRLVVPAAMPPGMTPRGPGPARGGGRIIFDR
ncbi:MAG: hypothetical protein ACREKS_03745 [Candidatus Rokuibacteriota bacterium]